MTLTTKIVHQYQSCGQVMPVPVVIKKLACWRPPMPLHPSPYLPPVCLFQQPSYQPPSYQPPSYQPPSYELYSQSDSYLHYINPVQQYEQQTYITHPNISNLFKNLQTPLITSQNDSDRYYRRPPDYPIVEYSSDIIVPSGNIVIQTTSIVPDGYLLCNGLEVSREIEATLFNVIGTFYGDGDNSTTFCLPDLEDEERSTHHYIIKR